MSSNSNQYMINQSMQFQQGNSMIPQKKEVTKNLTIQSYQGEKIHFGYTKPKQITLPAPPTAPGQQQGKQETLTLIDIPIEYNYGVLNKPFIKPFLIELPAIQCIGGIRSKPMSTYIKYSMMCAVEDPSVIDFFGKLHAAMNEFLEKDTKWASLGISEKNKAVNNPLYYSVNKMTQKRIDGKFPTTFLDVNSYSPFYILPRVDPNNKERLLPDGAKLDINTLSKINFDVIPTVKISKMRSSSQSTKICIEVYKAYIFNIVNDPSSNIPMPGAEAYALSDSSLGERASDQIKEVTELWQKEAEESKKKVIEEAKKSVAPVTATPSQNGYPPPQQGYQYPPPQQGYQQQQYPPQQQQYQYPQQQGYPNQLKNSLQGYPQPQQSQQQAPELHNFLSGGNKTVL